MAAQFDFATALIDQDIRKAYPEQELMPNKRVPLTDASGEVRELTSSDMRRLKPAAQVLDPALYAGLLDLNARARRGKQKSPTKLPTTIRLSPDVMAAFKATGAGWQTRIDNALKDWLSTHSPV